MDKDEERKQALQKIEVLKNEAEEALRQATVIANEHQVPFSWDFAYGMGGSYHPDEGWVSSSEQC